MRPHSTIAARAAWLCVAISIGLPATGAAQDESSAADALDVDPGATCVTAASLAAQVDAWLGGDPLDEGVRVHVRGAADDPRDVAFEVRRGNETLATRRFAPAPFVCAQLEATLALAIAMALKATLREELLEDLDAGRDDGQADTLALEIRSGFDLLPRRSFGGGATFAREFRQRFALRTALGVDGTRRARLEGASGSFDTWLLSARISGCMLFPITEVFRARACFGCALGALRASSTGFDAAAGADWLAWVALVNELGLSARLSGPWWLDLPVSLLVPLNDVSFQVTDGAGDPVSSRSLPVLGLTIGLAAEYRF